MATKGIWEIWRNFYAIRGIVGMGILTILCGFTLCSFLPITQWAIAVKNRTGIMPNLRLFNKWSTIGLSTTMVIGPFIIVEILCRNSTARQYIVASSTLVLLVATAIFTIATKYAITEITHVGSGTKGEDSVPPLA